MVNYCGCGLTKDCFSLTTPRSEPCGAQTSSGPGGLPQFHGIAFRVVYPGETSNLRILFGPSFNLYTLYTFVRELRDEGIEIIHCCSARPK
ncbi:hypothetical protein AGR7C_Lc20121 [Agrobacterium deltaense Zutra 3/1]|uniref:Uncharacterized protein n=1 Tax=Agrobacterium deltaense Zutra 3/1 TaxID=1183427 RepID=A0A1S7RLR3_9HYPH|nr:hypothetical protein AGR7C_Lc20121 [Agrobacterium deltaense Zutra 3/1]